MENLITFRKNNLETTLETSLEFKPHIPSARAEDLRIMYKYGYPCSVTIPAALEAPSRRIGCSVNWDG